MNQTTLYKVHSPFSQLVAEVSKANISTPQHIKPKTAPQHLEYGQNYYLLV